MVLREGQPAFRGALILAYAGECAITGCAVTDLLDAAHIARYSGPKSNVTANGLLLRTDIHKLFDLRHDDSATSHGHSVKLHLATAFVEVI